MARRKRKSKKTEAKKPEAQPDKNPEAEQPKTQPAEQPKTPAAKKAEPQYERLPDAAGFFLSRKMLGNKIEHGDEVRLSLKGRLNCNRLGTSADPAHCMLLYVEVEEVHMG